VRRGVGADVRGIPRTGIPVPGGFVQVLPLGEPLAQALAHPLAEPSTVALHWLGQAGFALRWNGRLFIIDPYLSDSLAKKYEGKEFPHTRMMSPPVLPEELRGVDAVFCTHRHGDHMDPGTLPVLAAASPDCRVIVPRAELKHAMSLGIRKERLEGLAAGQTLRLPGGAEVEALPSAHESPAVNESGDHLYLGYILTLGTVRLYHSGDCVPYDGLEGALRKRSIDLALLPINGRSAFLSERGIAGNFSLEEAAALCRAAGIPLLVCHHIGMFAFNTVDREDAVRRIARLDVECVLPEIDKVYLIAGSHRPAARQDSA
jgi:L-ascorbate metabolism protein UlaG (beta-lactamase superfamily)